jgi:hypothetical protein
MEDVGDVVEQDLGVGLHPTKEGQERLAEDVLLNLWPKMTRLGPT